MKRRLLIFIVLEGFILLSYLFWILFRVKTNEDKHIMQIKKERELSESDPLTGIMNRRALINITDKLRSENIPIAFVVIDIDNFKHINDKYGHAAGDDVLKNVAELLHGSIRTNDYVFRIGGDEFVIVMTDIDINSKETIKEKFKEINEKLSFSKGLPRVSLSAGIAFSDAGYYDKLYNEADAELYKVKESKRKDCKFYS